MIKVKGIYEGTHVRLLEPLHLELDTPVEVFILEMKESRERAFLERLLEEGLLAPPGLRPSPREEAPFEPISIKGPPLSQTIVQERH